MSDVQDDKDERRAERIPFDATVEVGGSLGPSFEAKAVDVSEGGMHLRTAYLPELGQPVACRFDAGAGGSVLASGEVVWKQEQDKGGEFGIKFADLDARSAATLDKIITGRGKVRGEREAGARVRLHIDGLGSPMRARVRGANASEVTVGSELGFLQVGKTLDLEDAETGEKRPAHIDRVEVEIDPESRVPRLVVALRYDDEAAEDEVPVAEEEDEEPAPATMAAKPEPELEPAIEKSAPAPARPQPEKPKAKLPEVLAGPAAKFVPALENLATRARSALAMLAARGFKKDEPAHRRTTAPPPGGALHATGRKVVRAQDAALTPKRPLLDKKRVAMGALAGAAVVVAFALLHKSAPAPPPAPIASQSAAPVEPAASVAALANVPPLLPPASAAPINLTPSEPARPGKVAPFGNPAVTHGTVLRLKMDGPIARINGATQATGFLVSLPGRKSVEPAGPLAARDARIASIKVANDGGGAELSVAFKDGVPNYQVRAKNDELEIVLAPPGKLEDPKKATAKAHEPHHAPKKTKK